MELGRSRFKFAGGGEATGESKPVKVMNWGGITVQVWGNLNATTVIHGRVDEAAPWEVLATFTNANGKLSVVGSWVELNAQITAYTSGTVVAAAVGFDRSAVRY